MKRACIVTMGCKVNRADSARMAATLAAGGCALVGEGDAPDVIVLNTCTVTGKSDAEVRQILRRLHRASPAARVVVAGCLPRAGAGLGDEFAGWCTLLTGPDNRGLLAAAGLSGAEGSDEFSAAPAVSYGDRVRPFLKVQDGCDSACAYCIVPRARGRARSAPSDAVLAQAGALLDAGYRELVLTGIHLGMYAKDRVEEDGLAALLERLAGLDGVRAGARVRLSSLEPLEVTPRLLAAVARSPFVCRHFHVPLQSGSDEILAAMNRPYGTARYARVAADIKAALPDACVGADLISGFPGETAAHHEETLALVVRLPIDYLHVFSFSPRPGTAAAAMKGRPPAAEVSRRVRELRALGEERRARFHRSMDGRTLGAIVERPRPGGGFGALTDNYIRATVSGEGLKTGMLAAIVLGVDDEGRATGRLA